MPAGGYRPGSGRKVGYRDTWNFRDQWNEQEVKEFIDHVKKEYKKNPKLMSWVGDHLFGRPTQKLEGTGADGEFIISWKQNNQTIDSDKIAL